MRTADLIRMVAGLKLEAMAVLDGTRAAAELERCAVNIANRVSEVVETCSAAAETGDRHDVDHRPRQS